MFFSVKLSSCQPSKQDVAGVGTGQEQSLQKRKGGTWGLHVPSGAGQKVSVGEGPGNCVSDTLLFSFP